MEILGLDPKITICKIAVLPIKLCPLNVKQTYFRALVVAALKLLPKTDYYVTNLFNL